MRRDIKDELIRGFLAINAMLRDETKVLRRSIEARREVKFNPNWRQQPRAPKGGADGGQWVDGGAASGRGPKQLQTRPSPIRPSPSPSHSPRIPAARAQARIAAPNPPKEDLLRSIPLSLFSRSPISAALLVSGDTPRPTITTRRVPGTTDLLLVVFTDNATHESRAYFQRIVRPERQIPIIVSGVAIGLTRPEPAVLETLRVDVRIDGDQVLFDPDALVAEYGRPIAGTTAPLLSPADGITVFDDDEASFVAAWRAAGHTPQQIQAALDTLRRNRRNNVPSYVRRRTEPGVAHTTQRLVTVSGQWLRGSEANVGVFPAQVASRLRGRTFSNFDEFREAFWREVANTPELARQFEEDDLIWMRKGFAPIARREQWFGGQMTYIIHHRRPIARDGHLYDMSNMIIVTPRYHHDILSRSVHYGGGRRRP